MGRWAARKSQQKTQWWRNALCGFLIFLGVCTLITGVIVRYTKDNIVDPEGYIQMVGPLPQEPAVSTALGTFTADRIFNGGTVEGEIAAFLPDRLSPAAPLLAETLKEQVAGVATKIAASDTFTNIWTKANQKTHEAVLAVAHSEPGIIKEEAKANLNLDGLFAQVRERFGGDDAALLSPIQQQNVSNLAINLQQSAQQLRDVVRVIETGSWALPVVALLFLAGAIFAAGNRRSAVLAIGVAVGAMGFGLLLAFRFVSTRWLDSFEQVVYRDAAQTVYEAFYGNLRARLVGVGVTGLVIVLIALLFGPYAWAIRTRRVLRLDVLLQKKR